MADLTQNAQNVAASNQATIRREYPFAASIVAGNLVFLNPSNRWALFDSDAGAGAGANSNDIHGIALNNGSNGQPAAVCTRDPNFNLGATLANGVSYYGSRNGGAVTADVPAASNYPVHLGVARSPTSFFLNPTAAGVAV